MKTTEGWVRGKLCSKRVKEFAETVKWVCVHCGRLGFEPAQLCYPVRIEEVRR